MTRIFLKNFKRNLNLFPVFTSQMLRGIDYVTDGRFISSEVDNFAIDVH